MKGRVLVLAGRVLLVLGLVAIAVPALVWALDLHREDASARRWLRSQPPGVASAATGATPVPTPAGAASATTGGPPAASPAGSVVHASIPVSFVLQVPRLGYLGGVREGVSSNVLAEGPGHYPSTPAPGQVGNVGIAAHNTYWGGFDRLRTGDQLILKTRSGKYAYQVTDVRVVAPDDRTVLAPAGTRRLTLTTCWPLWAGAAAPKRLAVLASM